MPTQTAQHAVDVQDRRVATVWVPSVATMAELRAAHWTYDAIVAQLDAHRWRRLGRAVVMHTGPLTRHEVAAVALANSGGRALLTAFTSLHLQGLTGWERDVVHVLVPQGTHVRRRPVPVRAHYTSAFDSEQRIRARPLHAIAPAALRAAATFERPRIACALLAAVVQQRLTTAATMSAALTGAHRLRHHAQLALALDDIAQGSHSLSEIDFVRLCRRHRLPEPLRQAVRRGPDGRRRYLVAEWRTRDGRRVVAEVDGALHMTSRQWWLDQGRQNQLAIDGATVLRFPTVVVRTEDAVVAGQLRRVLQ